MLRTVEQKEEKRLGLWDFMVLLNQTWNSNLQTFCYMN